MKNEQVASALQKALEEYRNHFDRNYPLLPCGWNQTSEEIIANIKRCIENNELAPPPVYKDDADY